LNENPGLSSSGKSGFLLLPNTLRLLLFFGQSLKQLLFEVIESLVDGGEML
jgi:hypothetical protein